LLVVWFVSKETSGSFSLAFWVSYCFLAISCSASLAKFDGINSPQVKNEAYRIEARANVKLL